MGGWGWGSSTPSEDEWPDPAPGSTVDMSNYNGQGAGRCQQGTINGQMPSTGCPCGTKPVKKWKYFESKICCKYTE